MSRITPNCNVRGFKQPSGSLERVDDDPVSVTCVTARRELLGICTPYGHLGCPLDNGRPHAAGEPRRAHTPYIVDDTPLTTATLLDEIAVPDAQEVALRPTVTGGGRKLRDSPALPSWRDAVDGVALRRLTEAHDVAV